MKKDLQSRLKKYGTLAASVVGVAAIDNADAQVVYTDVNPDQTFSTSGDSYNLDLNGDAIVDFTLKFDINTYSSGAYTANIVQIVNGTGNQNLGQGAPGNNWNYPSVLSSGDTIGSAGPWISGANVVSGLASYWVGSGSYGYWGGQSMKFLGLKFDIGGNTHYGWARVSVASQATGFTIHDYAYESTPNTEIIAGNMGSTSISENTTMKNVKVFVADKNLNINIPSAYQGYNVKVVDITGKVVVNTTLNKNKNIISLNEFTNGVYLVLIEGNKEAFAQKVILN
ncbi:MAG: hypothetical protein Kow0079_10590 [Vicingaceae bacterium]